MRISASAIKSAVLTDPAGIMLSVGSVGYSALVDLTPGVDFSVDSRTTETGWDVTVTVTREGHLTSMLGGVIATSGFRGAAVTATTAIVAAAGASIVVPPAAAIIAAGTVLGLTASAIARVSVPEEGITFEVEIPYATPAAVFSTGAVFVSTFGFPGFTGVEYPEYPPDPPVPSTPSGGGGGGGTPPPPPCQ